MNENMITVSGNVIAEPEMRQTKGGPMLTFRVASNHRYVNNRTGQWEEGVTNYYDVVAFRQLAVNVAESLHKGYGVFVRGQLRQRRYTRQDGSQGMSCEIAAKVVGPDLTYGVAQWMRRPRPQSPSTPAQAGAGALVPEGVDPSTGEIRGDTRGWERSSEEDAAGLPDPDRTAYEAQRDDEPLESYPARGGDDHGGDIDPRDSQADEELAEPAA